MHPNNYVIIMAGGVGSRFWPASRSKYPKQFLDILGTGESLLQMTYKRFLNICPSKNIYFVTHIDYKNLIQEQLPDVHDGQILCEPARNNTAPCVAYAAFKIYQLNPQANLVVAPSDHSIKLEKEFIAVLQKGLTFTANNDALLTLGIRPSRPDTGYGYIQFDDKNQQDGIFKVKRFTEKPDLEKASSFLASGDYVWNAGIFVWRAATIIKAFELLNPAIYQVFANANAALNTPLEQDYINAHYASCPNISIDYAIMEKADNVFTMPVEVAWSDVGTWASLFEEIEKDENRNVVQSKQAILSDTHDCIIKNSSNKLLIIKGLDNFIIVDEGDVLMIYPKDKEQEIKQVTERVAKLGGERYI